MTPQMVMKRQVKHETLDQRKLDKDFDKSCEGERQHSVGKSDRHASC